MVLKEGSEYNILGIIGGEHSSGVAYFEKGELKVVLEEERIIRQKPYKDFEAGYFRYPLGGLTDLIVRHNVDLSKVDYFTSFWNYETIKVILKDAVSFDLPEEKYIKIDHDLKTIL